MPHLPSTWICSNFARPSWRAAPLLLRPSLGLRAVGSSFDPPCGLPDFCGCDPFGWPSGWLRSRDLPDCFWSCFDCSLPEFGCG